MQMKILRLDTQTPCQQAQEVSTKSLEIHERVCIAYIQDCIRVILECTDVYQKWYLRCFC